MEFDLSSAQERWATLTRPEKIIAEAQKHFGTDLVMTSHFGVESALLLHIVTRMEALRNIRVFYIKDDQTFAFSEQLQWKFELNLLTFSLPKGGDKLSVMQRALKGRGVKAVMHGIRAYQTPHRAKKEMIELGEDGIYRIHPILHWTPRQVAGYFQIHNLPYHPTLPRDKPKDECGLHCFVQAPK